MTHALIIIASLTLTGGSISPREAKARTAEASRKEAVKICQQIERWLSEHYTGGEFSIEFYVVHPYTAHYVGEHFSDNWMIEWNNWRPDWPIGRGIGWKPEPKPDEIDINCEKVSVQWWKLDIAPIVPLRKTP